MDFAHIPGAILADLGSSCHVPPGSIEDVYSCTPIQLGLMAESLHDPGVYVYRDVFSLNSTVDTGRLCWAIDQVLSLNPILRTRIADNNKLGLVQVVVNHDITQKTQLLSDVSVSEYLLDDARQLMGLGTALWRSVVIGNQWVVTMHHAITDSSSGNAVADDVARLYRGQEPGTHAPFKAFTEHCNSIDACAAKEFWCSRFQNIPEIYPRDWGHSAGAARTYKKQLQPDLDGNNISTALLPAYLEAAWALTVHSYTRDMEMAFGVVYSGRTSAPQGLETTLGPTLTTIPIQVSLEPGMSVKDLLKSRAQQRRQLQAHPAMQYGLSRIRASSEAAHAASKFTTVLNMIFDQHPTPPGEGIFKFEYTDSASSPYTIMLILKLNSRGVYFEALYQADVVTPEAMQRLATQFEHSLNWLVRAPSGTTIEALPSLTSEDKKQIFEWNSISLPPIIEATLSDLFTKQARDLPDALAVHAGDGAFTFAELDYMSDLVAHGLAEEGLCPEDAVPFIFEKSAWTIVAILAIHKAGGTCIPIDPDHPAERKQHIFEVTAAKLVLTSTTQYQETMKLFPNVLVVDDELRSGSAKLGNTFIHRAAPNHAAYILFTSGSTGHPKGVILEHRSLATSLSKLKERMGMAPGLRVLQFAAYIWDISLMEIFGSLLSGSCLCIPSEETRKGDLAAFVNASRIDWMILTPTVLRTLTPAEIPGVRIIACAGESVDPRAYMHWGRGRRFFNAWGPTEAAVANSVAELQIESLYPETIGTAANCAIWIVDPSTLDLLPIGAVGEILLQGPTVARGYLGQTSASAFISAPGWAPTKGGRRSILRRFYRTGDLAKYNSDGSLCYLGRNDNQVKLRGQRFELGEVESVLTGSGLVRNVLVTIHETLRHKYAENDVCGTGGKTRQLVAVIALISSKLPSEGLLHDFVGVHRQDAGRMLQAVKDHAAAHLPHFMIPSNTAMDQGKSRPRRRRRSRSLETVELQAPVTANEKVLQQAWASVLDIPEGHIGRQSSFLELGGDSILAMQVIRRCKIQGLQVATIPLLRNHSLSSIAETGSPTSANDSPCLTELQDPNVEQRRDSAFAEEDGFERIVPALDIQSLMLATGEIGDRGFYNRFCVIPSRGKLSLAKLQVACERVLEQFNILRVVFIQSGGTLFQAVKPYTRGIQVTTDGEEANPAISTTTYLANFHLIPDQDDSESCSELRLQIHHALYDAWSLGILFRELKAAYADEALSHSPDFLQWTSHMARLSESTGKESTEYWKRLLHSSNMSFLAPNPATLPAGILNNATIQVEVPLEYLSTNGGTPASAFKAAWALLLSHALGTNDVVYLEVNSNRHDSQAESDAVCGPCATLVPVRARLEEKSGLSALVEQLQDQYLTSMPHQHISTRSIVKDCTNWAPWSAFGSVVVFQNHRSLPPTLEFSDGVECSLSANGTSPQLAQVWVMGVPTSEVLAVEIAYSPTTIPPQQANWIADALTLILKNMGATNLSQSIGELKANLKGRDLGPYTLPVDVDSARTTNERPVHEPSDEVRKTVSEAWDGVGLQNAEGQGDVTLSDCGADSVTALLLSEQLKKAGSSVDAGEVVEYPSQRMLASLIDSKILAVREGQ
ncbi:hypothetical protein Q7P37_007648 [Cladosporium fusiforme]